MSKRLGFIVAGISAGLLVTGIAFAVQDSQNDRSTINVALNDGQTTNVPVANAGQVSLRLSAGRLEIVAAVPNPGYAVEIEVAAGPEVEADFTGNGEKVKFNAELEDGIVRVRIETEPFSGSTSVTNGSTPNTSTTTASNGGSGAIVPGATLVLTDGQSARLAILDAGSLVLLRTGDSLQVVSTSPNTGWSVEVEVANGREVEGDFRSGGLRVKWNFELEDGVIRVKIENESGTSGFSGSSPTTGSTSTTAGSTGQIPNGNVTYSMGAAGSITVNFSGGSMSLASINAEAGWTVNKSEVHVDEIEVDLHNGELEAEIKVEIQNGAVKVELKTD